ncbi:MAG: hypothetical protein IIW79_00590 [Clostridia bacterium]|nr:hypothetical protein [Clostridia bacterium]
MSKRVLAFIASLVMIVSMFSCVMTVSAADGVAEVGGTCGNCGEADPDAPQDGYLETLAIPGFNLQFLNKVHIYGYVAINGQNIEDIKANWYGEATYVDADGKSQTQRIDLSEMFASGSYYLFSFNNLFSKEMSVPVTFTLYNAEGEQMSNAATYSIESYANSKGSGTDNLAKLTQALMCFGDAASAYFAK